MQHVEVHRHVVGEGPGRRHQVGRRVVGDVDHRIHPGEHLSRLRGVGQVGADDDRTGELAHGDQIDRGHLVSVSTQVLHGCPSDLPARSGDADPHDDRLLLVGSDHRVCQSAGFTRQARGARGRPGDAEPAVGRRDRRSARGRRAAGGGRQWSRASVERIGAEQPRAWPPESGPPLRRVPNSRNATHSKP